MASVDALALAYQTAKALAAVLQALANRLPLSQAAALQARSTVYLITAIQAPAIVSPVEVAAIGQTFAVAVAAIAADVEASDAAPAFADAAASASIAAPVFTSPARTVAGALARLLAACCEAALRGQSFVAEAKSDFVDQQSALAARSRIVTAMDGATDRIGAAAGLDVISLLSQVANTCSDHLVTLAADLKPLVQVQTQRSVPSSVLAWELYGDPERGEELVARNRTMTPLFMPTKVVALAPGS